jgi:hypothetical protein
LATRALRIVNGGAWNDAGSSLRVIGVPVKIISDIVVVGQGKNGRTDTEPPPGAPLGGGPIRAGPVTSIAGSTAASPTRHHRHQTDPTALAAARRQVIALAEALARAAAREDDAAEQREERSRSPPDSPAEQSPSRGAKDDTS